MEHPPFCYPHGPFQAYNQLSFPSLGNLWARVSSNSGWTVGTWIQKHLAQEQIVSQRADSFLFSGRILFFYIFLFFLDF